MRKSFLVVLLCSLFLTGIYATEAVATQIDLNDINFWADPASAVTFSGSGFSATLAEDASVSSVLLVNDPYEGDPNVIIPQVGYNLLFDYVFTEGANDNDEFGAFILDTDTAGSMGASYEFYTKTTGSGTISFDLTGLVGITRTDGFGLQFQLGAFSNDDDGLDSTVTISNLRIEESAVIPEPSTIFLLGLGLLGTAGVSRKKFLS